MHSVSVESGVACVRHTELKCQQTLQQYNEMITIYHLEIPHHHQEYLILYVSLSYTGTGGIQVQPQPTSPLAGTSTQGAPPVTLVRRLFHFHQLPAYGQRQHKCLGP